MSRIKDKLIEQIGVDNVKFRSPSDKEFRLQKSKIKDCRHLKPLKDIQEFGYNGELIFTKGCRCGKTLDQFALAKRRKILDDFEKLNNKIYV